MFRVVAVAQKKYLFTIANTNRTLRVFLLFPFFFFRAHCNNGAGEIKPATKLRLR